MSLAYTEDAPVIEPIHPKIAEFYKLHNIPYEPKVVDSLKFQFDLVTTGNPKQRRINTITRIRKGSSEFMWTNEDLISSDSNSNPRQFNQIVGKYDQPHPFREYVQSENAYLVTGIERMTTEYEIPYTKEALKELLQFCTDDTGYAVESDNITWTTNRKDFCELAWDDIVEKVSSRK